MYTNKGGAITCVAMDALDAERAVDQLSMRRDPPAHALIAERIMIRAVRRAKSVEQNLYLCLTL